MSRARADWAFCLALVATLWCARSAWAGGDPALEWRTVTTKHFRIHHTQGGEAVAARVAAIAEEARVRCQDLLGLVPREVLEIVLVDDVDSANGWTRVYPYDLMWLQAFPPGAESELATYADYLRSLVYHEYAHAIHMDEVSGLPALVNSVLGKTAVPNGATNTWFLEGIATFVETRLTRGGRIGSSLYAMYLRTAAMQDGLLDLSEMTTTPMRMPRGVAPYLYGGAFVDHLVDRHGVEAVTQFIRDYGRRLVPFAMNHLARRHFGSDFPTLYARFLETVREQSQAVAARVAQQGLVEGTPLTVEGEFHRHPVFTRDGLAILYSQSDGHDTPGIFRQDRATGRISRVIDCKGGCGQVSLSPDGRYAYLTHLEYHRLYYLFGDVYRVDLWTGEEVRLTRRARARDVSVAPDGTILFVTSEYDRVSVVRLDPVTNRRSTVIEAGLFSVIDHPHALGDGRVVFAAARNGQWDLFAAAPGQAPVALTNDRAMDRDVHLSPDERTVFFASDRGGIFNIHSLDLGTGDVRRWTNVLTGAFWPAVSPDGRTLVFALYGSQGYDLALLDLDAAGNLPLPGAATPEASPSPLPALALPPATLDDYSPWPSLRPRSLRPRYAFSTRELARLGAEVRGSDAIGRHAFVLYGESTLDRWSPTYGLSYAYDRFFPSLGLAFAGYPEIAFVPAHEGWALAAGRSYLLSASAMLPVWGRNRSFSASLGYSIRWITDLDSMPGIAPINDVPEGPADTRKAGLTLALAHDSRESYAWSISFEKGFLAALSLTGYHPFLGSRGMALTTSASYYQYLPLPWGSNHVLALLASAAMSTGDGTFEDAFSVGGFPASNPFQDLVNQQPLDGRYLRGFPTGFRSGNGYALFNAEYRLPLWYLHRGLDTLPLAARRVWATLFADGGSAWMDMPTATDFHWDVGGEIALSTSLFFSFDSAFRLGYAHGFGAGGMNTIYLVLSSSSF